MAEGARPTNRPQTDEEIFELCRLLVGVDRARLSEAIQRLEDREKFIEYVSNVLAESVQLGSSRDDKLRLALAPLVSQGVREAVQDEPETFGRALAPAMGPAIRQAVTQMFRGLVEGLESTIELSLSPRSWKWRVEAWRTGKPLAEVVFLHNLAYRVEHVFLVHRETGILLQRASRPDLKSKDPDLVSAMLIAIQDFVTDAFEAPDGDTLDSFQVGDLNVWAEHSGRAVLAAVIRGQARQEARSAFRVALENIELQLGSKLDSFDGDASVFDLVRPELEACLVEKQLDQSAGEKGKSNALGKWLLVAASASLLIWIVVLWVEDARDASRFRDLLLRLREAPGIVVTESERSGGRYRLVGLRDPSAGDPEAIAVGSGLKPDAMDATWEPYHAFHPQLVLARIRKVIDPPESVALHLEGGKLRIAGLADHRWVLRARQLRFFPGVSAVDSSELVDRDATAFEEAKRQVGSFRMRLRRREEPAGFQYTEHEIAALATEVAKLLKHAKTLSWKTSLSCVALGPANLIGDVATLRRVVARVGKDLERRAGAIEVSLDTDAGPTQDPLRPHMTLAFTVVVASERR